MTGSRSVMLGLAVVAIAALLAVGLQLAGSDDDPVTVRGVIGSEKAGLLEDPEIRAILADRYDLELEFASAGSLQMVQDVPDGTDFLWPGSQIADEERFEPAPNSEEIFYSPIVLYSWAAVTDALIGAGLVEQVDGTYYVTDFPRLIEMIDAEQAWSDVGLPQIPGSISITTSDPTTSNSGNSFAGLLASTYSGGRLIDDATIDDVVAQVQAFYARLGPLEQSSGFLFDQYISQGMNAYPIIAGYESSMIEYQVANQASMGTSQNEVRLLYPRPTVWSSHPMIPLTDNGDTLLRALRDDDIRRIAWERHGFRTGIFSGQNDPEALGIVGIPVVVDSVMPLPRTAVMKRVIEPIQPATPAAAGTPAATPASVP